MKSKPDPEALFAGYLERLERGEESALEALCAQHPEQAAALRAMAHERERFLEALGTDTDAAELASPYATGPREAGELGPLLERLRAQRGPTERYEVGGEVGAGGMGVIERIYDRDLRRELVLKRLRDHDQARPGSELFDPIRVGRLIDEAQITAQLEHPGIVPVHELGVDADGAPYYTMRHIEGRTLDEVVLRVHSQDEAAWTMPRLLGLLLRAFEALAHAHTRGVIHRDVTPRNILIGDQGQAYVVDWGLARLLDREQAHQQGDIRTDRSELVEDDASPLRTSDGRTVGTPYYMSPEQADGRLSEMDARSDVYAAGAVLYHVLSGNPPYARESAEWDTRELLAHIRSHPPVALEYVTPSIASELLAITAKAMRRAPRERYADMGALTSDLRAYLEGRVVSAHRTGAWIELRKWVGRNQLAAVSIAATVLFLVGGAWVSVFFAREAEAALTLSGESLKTTRDSTLRMASVLLTAGDDVATRQALALTPVDSRGFAWKHLALSLEDDLAVFAEHGTAVRGVAALDDGRVASAGEDGMLRYWDPWSGAQLDAPVPLGSGPLSDLAYWTNTRRLAVVSGSGELFVVDPAGERRQARIETTGVRFERVAWISADELATSANDGHVRIYGLGQESLELRGSWRAHWREIVALAAAPGGRLVTAGIKNIRDRTGLVRLWNVASAAELASVQLDGSLHVFDMAVSPDGTRLAIARADGGVEFRSLDDLRLLDRLPNAHVQAITALTFDARGHLLATAARDNSIRVWNVATGRRTTTYGGHSQPVVRLAFTPSGRFLLSGSLDGTARSWALEQRPGCLSLDGGYTLGAVDVSLDGQLVATGGDDYALRLYDPVIGVGIATLRGHRDRLNDVAFSLDGTRIITASADDTVGVWDVQKRTLLRRLDAGDKDVEGVAVDPRGSKDLAFVSVGRDGLVQAWPAEGSRSSVLYEGRAGLLCVAWSPNGGRIACGSIDGEIVVLGRDGGVELELELVPGPVLGLNFHPQLPVLAAGSEDGRVVLYDLRTGERTELHGHRSRVFGVDFSPDGEQLATASYDLSTRIWDWSSGAVLLDLVHHTEELTDVAWFPDGAALATIGFDHRLQIWETERGAEVESLRRRTWANQYRLQSLVDGVFLKSRGAKEVLERLEGAGLDPFSLSCARYLVEFRGDDPELLLREARSVATSPDEDPDDYALALAKIELALEVLPGILNAHTLRAAALVRCGRFEEALPLLRKQHHRTLPGMLTIGQAFLALAEQAAGGRAAAERAFEAFRSGVEEPLTEELETLWGELEIALER